MLIYKILKNFSFRTIKLFIFAWYVAWATRRGYGLTIWPRPKIGTFIQICRLRRYFIPCENLTLIYKKHFTASVTLNQIVAFAWLCEKMKINIKIESFNCAIFHLFKNNVLALTKEVERPEQKEIEFSPSQNKTFVYNMSWLGLFSISSEYGHKIISKLSVKEYLIKSANSWLDEHIKGDWVAVHYRGTDIEARKTTWYKDRYRINLVSYIKYLQGVLDNQTSIFACSDQAQFIDKMKEAFPGRVFARDINRSYNFLPIHWWIREYVGERQRKQEEDALIDILILAKAELIYTTGSGFVDVVRYFNPKIKIVSMDGRRIGRGKNNVPMPRKDLFKKLSIPL